MSAPRCSGRARDAVHLTAEPAAGVVTCNAHNKGAQGEGGGGTAEGAGRYLGANNHRQGRRLREVCGEVCVRRSLALAGSTIIVLSLPCKRPHPRILQHHPAAERARPRHDRRPAAAMGDSNQTAVRAAAPRE